MITGGTGAGLPAADMIARVAAAARSGVALIQIRERHLEGRALADLVGLAVGVTSGTRSRIIVNDRVDVALAAGAHGVHLRADSMPASRVRAAVPRGFLIGRSVHDAGTAEAAATGGGLDYLMFGTVFPSRSKPGREAAGVSALAGVVSATTLPVLAVGGIDLATVSSVAFAGAAGFAAISMFADVEIDRIPGMVGESNRAFMTRTGAA